MAVPPPASILRFRLLSTLPPSMDVDPAPHSPYPPPPMSPTPIVFPWLPPELISPMTTIPPSALAFARPPLPADAVSPPPPFSAATRLAASPMRCRLFLLPPLLLSRPLLPPPLLFPLESADTSLLLLLLPLLSLLFLSSGLSLFRSSFFTALRSDLFCSMTLTLPSSLISAFCASSALPPDP